MCRTLIVPLFLLLASEASAQNPLPVQESHGRSYFGAPVVKYTVLRDQAAVMFGGRGGWHITPSLSLGGALYGTATEVDAPIASLAGPLDLKLESFGFELEYALHPASPTHLIFGAFIGGAAARYVKDRTNEQDGETDFMRLLEPAVGVEQTVTDWLHLNVAVSYRFVSGVEQSGLNTADLQGAAAALAVKLGRF